MEETTGTPDGALRSGTWRFGQVVLDEATARLHVAGTSVELDRSSYDVLLALLRHAGEIVTKDELLDAGWPGRVVSENSLAKAVSRLRQALTGDGEAIRVVHGYGYRLTAAVQLQPSATPLLAHPGEALRLREGDAVPHRSGWRLERRLGAGSSGVTFLASSQAGESHAFKFAQGETGVHGIKREIALTRYIRAVKADLPGVALVLDWNLRQPPFFVELPYFVEGHLADWAAARGGLPQIEIAMRLELCASLCKTVAGLHEIGVIHKDLKPENLYPCTDADGHWRLVVSDLGAGEAALSPRLAELGLTLTLLGDGTGRAGSLMYLAPEVIAGEEPTVRSDVFALGVLLYQLVVGNLRRPLAPGWENDVDDPLLREDIALAAASNPERRQIDANALAEHLRTLDARRARRDNEESERMLAEQREQALQRERARRRLWLTAAVASSIGLLGMLGMYGYAERERRSAETAAARADREAAKARGVADFLVHDLLGQADMDAAQASLPKSLRQAIDRAAKAVDTRFAGSADVAADVHGALGAAYVGINLFESSASEYEKQARVLRRAVPVDPVAIARAEADACLSFIWAMHPRSRTSCEQARKDLVAAGEPSERVDVNLGLLETRMGRNMHALALLSRAGDALRRNDSESELHADALWFKAIAYGQLGRLRDEEQAYREAIAILRGQDGWRLGLATSEHARVLLETGATEAGLARLSEASRILSSAMGADHAYARDPVLQRMRYDSEVGDWSAVRRLAEPAYRDLLAKVGFESRTVRAGFLAMAAHAKAGDARAARRIMVELDDARAHHGDGEDLPYLRAFRWQAYAATHIALGEFAPAAGYLDKLRALAASPDADRLTGARLDCLLAEFESARGETAAALASAHSCRRRTLDATSPDSPLLGAPDRLLAALGEAPRR